MLSRDLQFFPLPLPFLVALFLLLVVAASLIHLGLVEYAYTKMGVGRQYIFSILITSLVGSYINIPLAQLPAKHMHPARIVRSYGMRYVIPASRESKTVIALNLGGAVIPALLSCYLIAKKRLYYQSPIAVMLMAAIVYWLATPVHGLGVAVPTLLLPFIAAGIAFGVSLRSAPSSAYVCGTLGTLIGADLLNLGNLQELGAPIMSIGGAGTFDGIFLTGLLAVLLS